MKVNQFVSHTLHGLRMAAASLAVLQMSVVPVLATPPTPAFGGLWDPGSDRSGRTTTPIKHVFVIIGENRSFDHVFATYVPRPGQRIHNLLSQGIIQLDANSNAIPGPNFRKAQQLSASDLGGKDSFLLSPPKQEFPADQLPVPEAGGPSGAHGYFTPS
jgi:phospholipase C